MALGDHGLGSNHVLRFVDFAIHEIQIDTLVKHIIKPGAPLQEATSEKVEIAEIGHGRERVTDQSLL